MVRLTDSTFDLFYIVVMHSIRINLACPCMCQDLCNWEDLDRQTLVRGETIQKSLRVLKVTCCAIGKIPSRPNRIGGRALATARQAEIMPPGRPCFVVLNFLFSKQLFRIKPNKFVTLSWHFFFLFYQNFKSQAVGCRAFSDCAHG